MFSQLSNTVFCQYAWGIGSRTPRISKSKDAQVLYKNSVVSAYNLHTHPPIYFNFFFPPLAVLRLRLRARALPSCGKWGPPFIAVRGPLTIAASLVAEHRLQRRRLSRCGSRAQLLRGMWDPPRPGPEPVSPALAGRLSTTAPPGKPLPYTLNKI